MKHNLAKDERNGQFRDSIPAAYGFRKFCITQMAKAKVDTEVTKILTGHSIGVRSKYLNYTDEDLLQEYLKAVDLLTINQETRLQIKVGELSARNESNEYIIRQKLEQKGAEIQTLKEQMKSLKDAQTQISLKEVNFDMTASILAQLTEMSVSERERLFA